MEVWSENLPENHVDLRHCTVTYRLKDPVGDRACLWTAADGNFHAITGMDHDEVVRHAFELEGEKGRLRSLSGATVLLYGTESLRLDGFNWSEMDSPLGELHYCSTPAEFHWLLESGIWSGELDGVDFFVRNYNSEARFAEGGITLINDYTNWREVEIDPFAKHIRILERLR